MRRCISLRLLTTLLLIGPTHTSFGGVFAVQSAGGTAFASGPISAALYYQIEMIISQLRGKLVYD